MENKETIFDVKPEGTREEIIMRKAKFVKNIVVGSALKQLEDSRTYQLAAGIGLYQGLKYKGSLKEGVKAGLATIMVVAGVNVVSNIASNADDIKKA